MPPQLTLSFPRNAPTPRPELVCFASGTNDPPEIRGLAGLGIPIGFSAGRISRAGLAELVQLVDTVLPIFGDTGAYAEAMAGRASITPRGWSRRLAILEEVAHAFRGQFSCVAPDRVGCQDESLARLRRFRDHCRTVTSTGAELLLPLPPGSRPRSEFHAEAAALLGIPGVPALPMAKGLTTAADAVAFARTTRPERLHLLGLGMRGHAARTLLPALRIVSPGTRITLDATLVTSAVGRHPDGSARRPLTRAQDAIRRRGVVDAFGETRTPAWGIHLDYTDAIANPSQWLSRAELDRVAREAGLASSDTAVWVHDPDRFLHRTEGRPGGTPRWQADPCLSTALDRAWYRYLERRNAPARKEAAIRIAFRTHPAARQFPPAHPTGRTHARPAHPSQEKPTPCP